VRGGHRGPSSAADGERIGDVLASLLAGAQTGAPAGSLRAALDQLVVQSQRAPVVLCIDDIHRISDQMLLDVLAHLGASSSSPWITARVAPPAPAARHRHRRRGAPARPLSTESARALWADLGSGSVRRSRGFDALDAARRGSPFALRRAFATGRGRATAWGVAYPAVRHHSRCVVSIKRLRDALGGDGSPRSMADTAWPSRPGRARTRARARRSGPDGARRRG
jgi:hypothetical protein